MEYSSRFKALEDQFIKISNGEDNGALKEKLFKLNKAEKDLLENYMHVKNNGLLWAKTTMDANGRATVLTEDGRPQLELGVAA